MPDSKRAERLLSLVMPTDRAASIVGDLTENAPGGLSFWTSIVRIGFSMVGKEIYAHPGDMAYVTFGGALMNIVLFCAFAFGVLISWIALLIGAQVLNLWRFDTPARETDSIFVLWLLIFAIPAPYMAGRWSARRAPGRELAASTVFGLLAFALWILAVAVFGNNIQFLETIYGSAPTAVLFLAVIASQCAGAIHVRNHPVAWERWLWFEKLPFDKGFQRTGSRWRLSAPGEQKYADIIALVFTPPLIFFSVFIQLPELDARIVLTLVAWWVAACLAVHGVITRPLQWIRPGNRVIVWLGRILFVGAALGIAWLKLR